MDFSLTWAPREGRYNINDILNIPYILTVLGGGVVLSTILTIFLVTLPSRYLGEHAHSAAENKYKTSVTIVVLGDIGRSPRMQYHALSIARRNGRVTIIGIKDSDVHPEIASSKDITIVPISTPAFLTTSNRTLMLALAPLKLLWQVLSLYYAMGYKALPSEWILVQNPPSIPTFLIAFGMGFLRSSKFIIDWHNFGFSILALRLGAQHWLVRRHQQHEFAWGKSAEVNFTVSDAMARALATHGIEGALPLHDRPFDTFQPVPSAAERRKRLAAVFDGQTVDEVLAGSRRLLVSATSWTPDEDFSLFLQALVTYCESAGLPALAVVITGKGPLQARYESEIDSLVAQKKLPSSRISIQTRWFPSVAAYAELLSAADLGVSLHTSSSGLDLPMKVVDMFGAGIPVVGVKFEAWSELVTENVDGRGFGSAEELATVLTEVLGKDGKELKQLKDGAMKQSQKRWDEEWDRVAGRVIFYKKTYIGY